MNSAALYWSIMLFLLIQSFPVFAQEYLVAEGKTEIIQDSRVALLVNKHIQVNKAVNTIEGFRIQIFSDSGINSKNNAQAVHDEFQARFPEMAVYLTFKSPNYKVRIGDFRTRLDAQRFFIQLTIDYPNAFIISDQINLPKTD